MSLAAAIASVAQLPAQSIIMATTTSVRDAGLLEEILPDFTAATGIEVRVVAVGSGQALELGRRGEADIFILHSPAAEEQFVRDGYGILRTPLMHNEFVLIGPPADPARLASVSGIAAALRLIAEGGHEFVSRGDNSGTHTRERQLWQLTGIEPSADSSWYVESGQGMGATLQIAYERAAYTLSDIGTYLSHPTGSRLRQYVGGDPALHNPYHVIVANPDRFDHVKLEAARRLRSYLVSADVQRRIGQFGVERFGRPLFVPDHQ